MAGVVAIVDPFEAGALYAPLLAAVGVAAHAVFSDPPLVGAERRATLREADFTSLHDVADGADQVLAGLAAAGVSAVLAGHEHGVLTADRLSAALGLPGNDAARSLARRDKQVQAAQAAAAGLRVPAQHWASAPTALVEWAVARGRWPVVAKPARGYGGHQVVRCATADELAAALDDIFARPGSLGVENRVAGVQERLRGRELAVDTVSWEGRHRVVALWAYHRPGDDGRGAVPLFAAKELLVPSAALLARCQSFASRLLDALGVRFGPAHCELMEVDGDLVLIELGARLHGGSAAHALARHARGWSQADEVVRHLDQREECDEAPAPSQAGRGCMFVLRNGHPDRRFEPSFLRRLAMLPGVVEVRWNGRPGEPAPAIAGLVLAVAADGEQLARTENAVRALERDGLFVPGPGASARTRPATAVELVADRAAIEALAGDWDRLLTRSRCNRTFASWRWFVTSCDVAADLAPRVFVARAGGVVTGILALVEDAAGRLGFPGELADYHDAVVGDGDSQTVNALLAAARATGRALAWSCLRPDAHLRLALAPPSGQGLACPFVDLAAGYDGYLASRGGGFRSQLQRARRRAAAAGLTVGELSPASLPPAALPSLFLALHGARFTRSCFDRPRNRAFVERALPALHADGRLRVFAVRDGDETLAINLCAVGRRSLCYWNGGWRPQAARFAPGKLLLDLAIRTACHEGLTELDLMRGAETYKAGWATDVRWIDSWVEPAP